MKFLMLAVHILFISMTCMGQDTKINSDKLIVHVEWENGNQSGTIEVHNGILSDIEIIKGRGKAKGNTFEFKTSAENRIEITFDSVQNNPGAGSTLVTINTNENPFSFFLRDVNNKYPIYISDYRVVILESGDSRSYDDIKKYIENKDLTLKLQQIENAPEESFESVKDKTRNQSVPTWLGISRDIRIFQLSQSLEDLPAEVEVITPKKSAEYLTLPETNNQPVHYLYNMGRGQAAESKVVRRLENGVFPILHTHHMDGEINYHSITFASLESQPLVSETKIGTDFLVADHFSAGHMFTEEQQEIVNKKIEEFEKNQTEQTVLYCRIEANNTGQVPRYAWYKNPRPGRGWWDRIEYTFDASTGLSFYTDDKIFCISKLNGEPLLNEEMAVLLQPGESALFEFFIPHSPISRKRALTLSRQSFENRYAESKKFWQEKLNNASKVVVPEKRIEEMIQAGLLHLDLITYGKEPESTLAPMIGIYSPIGTESSPIMQFYCSMGLYDLAKRSLMYFLDKQHEDGLIQNFGGYMVETGAALWSMGEYFRYTNNIEWVKQVKPKLIKSCDYLLNWRERNKKDNLRYRGYGMIDGKVADPEDPYHQYMLNAYGYFGLNRVAEMLDKIDPYNSGLLKKEAEDWKEDILSSFYHSMAHSPVVPLGNGSWCPTVPPWTEATGPRSLFVDEDVFFSHGTFTAPDAMLGPLYLIFCEVLKPDEPASKMMLNYHSELFYENNAAFSQPYYSRHNWVQLKRGMVKPFLKTYYNTFSALADRETYTFWEHIYHASPHKTHEEAWFLMETRWMLYLEDGSTLKLLSGIPRKWMEDSKSIKLENVASYFGPLSLQVDSHINEGYIVAEVVCMTDQKPSEISLRLPHPDFIKPLKVEGGIYNEKTESITIAPFNGKATVRLEFE